MALIKRSFYVLLSLTLLQACSGGSDANREFTYNFVAEDAPIIGLIVTDAESMVATEMPDDDNNPTGTYAFETNYEPVPPITFRSQNSEQAPFTTYQDIDGNGKLSPADIPYNTGMTLHFLGFFDNPSERTIHANPISSLIPADGIPENGIAGLPAELFSDAFNSGIAGSAENKETLNRLAAKITAVQELLIATQGLNESSISASINLLNELTNASSTSGLATDSELASFVAPAVSQVIQDTTQSELINSATEQIALTLQEQQSDSLTYYESIVAMVQAQITSESSSQNISSLLSTTALENAQSGLTKAINTEKEINESGGLVSYIANLFIVPINIGDSQSNLTANGVNDFSLTYHDEANAEQGIEANTITIDATNAFFNEAVLTYEPTKAIYAAKINETSAVSITLTANSSNFLSSAADDIKNMGLLATCEHDISSSQQNCSDSAENLRYYALANNDQICNAQNDSDPENIVPLFSEEQRTEIDNLNLNTLSCD